MLEILGLTTLEEIGLLGVVGVADIVQPELLLAEGLVLAGIFIYRAIKKHREEQNKPVQPSNDDDEEPVAPDNLDDDVIEEDKEIDK